MFAQQPWNCWGSSLDSISLIPCNINLKIASYFASKMSLFVNSRGIAIWDKLQQAIGKYEETKGRSLFIQFLEEIEKVFIF